MQASRMFHLFLLILPLFAMAQLDDNSILDDFGPSTTSTTMAPPPDPFRDLEDERTLDEKLDELDMESQEIVIDYVRNGRKLYGDVGTVTVYSNPIPVSSYAVD